VVQLPEREYIELYNNSTKLLNLGTVQLQDETATINLPNTVIRPNEYIILCSTTSVALFENFLASSSTQRRVIGVTSFPSLNNTGEKLTLRSAGKLLHTVNYTDQWYGDAVKQQGGWSLEMIDTNNPCGESANWTASKDAKGGTPAQANSVRANLLDRTPPILLTINVISPTQLQVVFNENLDSLSAVNPTNYVLNNAIRIAAVQWADDKTVYLNLANNLNNSLLYELQVSNIRDCSGNVLQTARQTFGIGETPQLYEVVMTELMPDPSPVVANLPESEYIELYNRTDKVLNLGAATLSNGTITARFGFVPILPKSYILVVPSSSVENFRKLLPQATIVGLSPWISLANDKAVLTLRNATNRLVQDVNYTLDFYRDADKRDGGWSMEMIDENYPCLGSANWQASTDRNGGTPTQRN
ncbi:MAG: Ig-like domain-containing protein, partial [Thermoflexibacteraceae bacterium]